jgi:hypothetical protein
MTTLTHDQITAGAAILCDHGQPIGRNTALMLFDAMTAAAPRVSEQADEVLISPMFLASAAFCIENYNTVAPKTRQAMIDKLLNVSERLEAKKRVITQQAAPEAPTDGIRGPLTDAQRNDIRALAATLHGGQIGTFDNIIRQASVAGYVNGRADFASPVAAPEAPATQQAHVMPPTRGTGSQQDEADTALCKHINALLALDAAGALVPHGIGGHARELLQQASTRLAGAAKGGAGEAK